MKGEAFEKLEFEYQGLETADIAWLCEKQPFIIDE